MSVRCTTHLVEGKLASDVAGGDLELAVLVDPALATKQVVHAGCHLVVTVAVEPFAGPHQLHVHEPFNQYTITRVYQSWD